MHAVRTSQFWHLFHPCSVLSGSMGEGGHGEGQWRWERAGSGTAAAAIWHTVAVGHIVWGYSVELSGCELLNSPVSSYKPLVGAFQKEPCCVEYMYNISSVCFCMVVALMPPEGRGGQAACREICNRTPTRPSQKLSAILCPKTAPKGFSLTEVLATLCRGLKSLPCCARGSPLLPTASDSAPTASPANASFTQFFTVASDRAGKCRF